MKITLISDTHGHHRVLKITETDFLIHAGDISGITKKSGVIDFFAWYASQPAKHKIVIAGNHDGLIKKNKIEIPEEIIYLHDSGITLEGLNIWGSPHANMFSQLASPTGEEEDEPVRTAWDKIPLNTDILITHTPPLGILDLAIDGTLQGSAELFRRMMLIKPIVHAFGHIHEAYGILMQGRTTFVNASIVNIQEEPVHEPIIVLI
jgi:Icc-related predicted phosphoesterase